VGKIFIIVGLSQHCQILILIFYFVKIVCWIQLWNLCVGLHVCVCVCVCLFFSIVRQSKQCNWIYSLWGFKCFNAKNNKTNLTTCVCVKTLSLLGSTNIVRY
jgi:hypothetical protein